MSLDLYFPDQLVGHLCSHEPKLQSLSPKIQRGVPGLIMMSFEKRHHHREHPHLLSFGCRELQELLGREYIHVCQYLNLLTSFETWSKDQHVTKAYAMEPRWIIWYRDFLTRAVQARTTCALINADGQRMTKKSHAIRSKDANGNNAKTKAKVPLAVPVNLTKIKDALAYLNDPETAPDSFNGLLDLSSTRDAERLERIRQELMGVCILADNHMFDVGMIPQKYVEALSGRLFGIGLHLQNVCREVKYIALCGMGHEYDLANCHFFIFAQLAELAGYQCLTIQDYLANKEPTRQRLAQAYDLTVEQVKECLLATLYGSNASSPTSVIAKGICPGKAKLLGKDPFYKALRRDIRRGTVAILRDARQDCKWVFNAMRKGISRTERKGKLLAHILQGQEAQMLNIVLRHYGQDMLLLQHDGFTCSTQVDVGFLQNEIQHETGLSMQLEHAHSPL